MENLTSIYDLQVLKDHDILVTTGLIHAKVHDGKVFRSFANFLSIDDNATREMYWKAPDSTVRCHVTVAFESELAGEGTVRETPTVTLSGTLITPYNQERNSSNTATVITRSSPTFTGSGTLLDLVKCGGGKKGEIGGINEGEFIAKQGTIYLFRFTSKAGSNEAVIRANWIEL